MNIFKTGKKLVENADGKKSTCLAFSYQFAFYVVMINIICFYVLMFVGGAIPQFTVYGDMLKDFAVPMTTATITFCSIAVTTCLGATYVDSKSEEETKEEVK